MPGKASRIPATLEEATSAAWLSDVLGAEVGEAVVGAVDHRVSTNIPVRATFADGSSQSIWIKGYFTEIGQQFRSSGVAEVAFYRDLVEHSGVRTLKPVAARVDFDSQENVLVTEDECEGGAHFLHSLDPYSPEQAAQTLEQLATLHARTWTDPAWADTQWLANRCPLYTVARGVEDIRNNFEGPLGAGIPEAVRDPVRLFEAYRTLGERVGEASPWSVIHGDPHIGNVCIDGAGQPFLVDWQLVQRGPWYIDVGYHLASVLSVVDRRRSEAALVRHYLDRLASHGIEIPEQEVEPGLCAGMVHGFYLWAITLKVDPRKTAVILERLGAAVADHGALDSMGP